MDRPCNLGPSQESRKEFRCLMNRPFGQARLIPYKHEFNTFPGSPGNRGTNPLVLKLVRGNRKLLNIIKDD